MLGADSDDDTRTYQEITREIGGAIACKGLDKDDILNRARIYNSSSRFWIQRSVVLVRVGVSVEVESIYCIEGRR